MTSEHERCRTTGCERPTCRHSVFCDEHHREQLARVDAAREKASPKLQPVAVVFGIDTPDDYRPDSVRAALGAPEIDAAGRDGSRTARVLFLPSFHAEVCLTASDHPSPHVTLTTMQANLWYWGCYERQRDNGKWPPGGHSPQRPQRWNEGADVPPERWAAFWAELRATDPDGLRDTSSSGLDGMTVHAEYRDRSGRGGFAHWYDGQHERHGQFVDAMYRLASDLLADERSVRALEHLHGYMRLGLPIKVTPGQPLTVRLFGSLSLYNEAGLREAFAAVPLGTPVLMDLSNFDGMGTMLYGAFAEFAARPGPTAWWASPSAVRHLMAIGVPQSRVFAARDEAVAALAAIS